MTTLKEKELYLSNWKDELESFSVQEWALKLYDLSDLERACSAYLFKNARYQGKYLNGNQNIKLAIQNFSIEEALKFNDSYNYNRWYKQALIKWPIPEDKKHINPKLKTNIYYDFNWLSIDVFYKKFKWADGAEVWNAINNINLMPAREMPKLSNFSNSEDKESIENIKSELSKLMKEVNDPIEDKITEIIDLQESEDYDFDEYQKLENELLELEERARKVQFDIIDETDLKPRLHWGENIAVEVYEESIGGEDRSNSIQIIIDHITTIANSIISPAENAIKYEENEDWLEWFFEELRKYLRSDFDDLNLFPFHNSKNPFLSIEKREDAKHEIPDIVRELLRKQNEINPKQREKIFEEVEDITEKISGLEKKIYGSKASKDLGALYAKRGILYSQIDDFFSAEKDLNESVFLLPNDNTLESIANNYFNNSLYKEAGDSYSELLKNNDTAEYYFKRGLCYAYQDMYDKSLDDFEKAIQMNYEIQKIKELISKINEIQSI